tara:strand:- start:125 stop:1438 length:1314 start_codon:yes stop_codon:yes gene_type:complete
MARISGDTLSLNNLAGARGITQGANVSLNAINNSAGTIVKIDDYGIDTVGSITGYTYAVEATDETYTLGFTGAGSKFGSISSRYQNFTWSVTPTFNMSAGTAGFLSIGINQDASAVITVGGINPQSPSAQTTLLGAQSHTLSGTFADGFNHHATNYNIAQTKTVYAVDSYDGNSTALCLTIDSPVTLSDGTIVEVGDLEEGDVLRGFSIGGLGTEESSFLDWSTDSLTTTPQDVEVVNLVYSFAGRYYNINNGEITATAEHPMLVKDGTDGEYRFKEMFNITTDDKLIKEIDGVITEVDVSSIDIITRTTEIVSIDVETNDTYLVNGYITHNKGGNSHTDETAGSAPTALIWTNGTHVLSWTKNIASTTAFDVQIDNNSDFSSPLISQTQWSALFITTLTDGGSFDIGTGTRYARVRQYDSNGLLSNYSSTLTFTVS